MDAFLKHVFYFVALLLAGMASGFINTLASSGSAISLPLLLMLGLPALAANATNRLPVLFGSLMALRTFQANGKMNWPAAGKIVVPAVLGSIAGVYLAGTLHNRQLGIVITAAVMVALLLLFTKLKQALAKDYHRTPRITPLGLFVLSFVRGMAGVYRTRRRNLSVTRSYPAVWIRSAARKRFEGVLARLHHAGASHSLRSSR